jgi:aminopeptidase N
MKLKYISILMMGLLMASTSPVLAQKKKKKKSKEQAPVVVVQEKVEDTSAKTPVRETYNGMYKRTWDLRNTKLQVSFNWDSAFIYGKANLTLKPYFYSTQDLELDAKGFEIKQVALVSGNSKTNIPYDYDGRKIKIHFDKACTRNQEIELFIEYIGMPNKLTEKGSSAITSAKGLYFINPGGKVKDKPVQIWTQGETEANSCWMPTIDGQQEKHTQELQITVPSKYVTLSNGLRKYSKNNPDGTRTDVWVQDLPHSTYLTMMAIGEFAVVKDKWRDMEVDYYVEKEYEPYARMIFGKTPKMIEFFSSVLGVTYPWDKYSQIVVKDYVSGAMENTSATIHGDFVQVDDREYEDVGEGNEDVISHELFHHWFGDLVTCESWANLPLNESFATYGEYLWAEYAYGRDRADQGGANDLSIYLQVGKNSDKTLFRPQYADKEDMFDVFSYQKGGRVLHMLRKYVGDEAFFAALRYYLESNRYQNTELSDLRKAFEEVTGEDLNWFFSQWFTKPGHPMLKVEVQWDANTQESVITTTQKQDFSKSTLYILPLDIDVITDAGTSRSRIWLKNVTDTFRIKSAAKPLFVNFDAEKQLLGEIEYNYSKDEAKVQIKKAKLLMDRINALEALSAYKDESDVTALVFESLKDSFYAVRLKALDIVKKMKSENKNKAYETVLSMALSDEKSAVRNTALLMLSSEYADKVDTSIYIKLLNDKSYRTSASAMRLLARSNPASARAFASKMEGTKSSNMRAAIADLYSKEQNSNYNTFYVNGLSAVSGFQVIPFINFYKSYINTNIADKQLVEKAVEALITKSEGAPSHIKTSIKSTLSSIKRNIDGKEDYKNIIDTIKSAEEKL